MSEQSPEVTKQTGFQYQIWLMMLMVGGVILSGFLLMPKTEEQRQKMIGLMGTTNQGQLIRPMVDLSAVLSSLPAAHASKWKLIIVGGVDCDAGCKSILTTSRQVHVLLGKLTGRLERIYLPDIRGVAAIDLEQLQVEHPYLTISAIDRAEFGRLLAGSSADWDMHDSRYFVVTPEAQAILYYTQNHEGSGLLDDLKHLLKYSPDR